MPYDPRSTEMKNYFKSISLSSLFISNRTVKALRASNITTLDELLNLDRSVISSIRGIGAKALGEIIDIRRLAFIEPRASYDLDQLLIYIRERMPGLNGRTDHEILHLNISDILLIYNSDLHYSYGLLAIAQKITQHLPYFGTPYPFLNLLASIDHITKDRSVSGLIDYLFQDFSEVERKVLLSNYDGKRRIFAKLGRSLKLSRERVRQIHQIATEKFDSPYQKQKQAGFIFFIKAALYEHYKNNVINELHQHCFRGNSKKRLREVTILVTDHSSEYGPFISLKKPMKSLPTVRPNNRTRITYF